MTNSRQVPISEAMTLALEHHQAGRLDVAEAIYRAVLDSDPDHAGARHGLALLALQAGRPAEALPALAEAIEREPGNAAHWSNYAVALAGGGQPVAARDVLQKALALGLGGATIEKALAQVRRMVDVPPPRIIETFPGDEPPATGR